MSGASGGADVVAVICGPTAAGKSDIAMKLAARSGRAILVADSRQVYCRFDIGTAKPPAEERRLVPHFGLDLANPTERFSAAQWAEKAGAVLDRPENRGAAPIVVGGTGLYLRALFEGLFVEPAVDEERRKTLFEWLDGHSTDELRRWTFELDPSRAALGRTQLLRAVGVALLTGERISRLHETRAHQPGWNPRYLVVDPGAALRERIDRRFEAMVAAGWVEEVRSLADLPDDAPAWKATGYRLLREVVRGTMSLPEARERILIETRQYAKRQRTWFRHQLPDAHTTRVDPAHPDASALIDAWWQSLHGA